ncbi:hypothetical protein F511_27981 [Dorcoceras hygrometricum]|uniref:Dystroglycan-like n=1 Tax=Dorcoceras hygrometricum TaxID=472368 RepID=A0A2Z7AE22_9LAMI|nr:hypothetical protein F511_27981 [Dorcoceras hygrometricum]
MASAFYSNSQHVDFDSVLGMDDQGMVSMFQALMASGLAGFLGCPAVIYEDALVDFFENASVREGVIISTVAGQLVEISEEWFAESFELPVDGLGDLSEIPKDVIFDARSIVSLSGEPISLSGRKNQMKFEFRLLCDIMAKAISVKAGSNQAKGFAIQISLMLENIPNLELGASSEFPASKILTDKTVHQFVSINDRDGAEEATEAPKPKAVSKKRPAADPTVFALRLSQFCIVHIQYSLFSRLPTEDITDFLSSIALERTILRSVQNSIGSADVPHVQFSLEQRQSYSSSADSSSSLNFDATDLDAPVSSLPPAFIDFSAALADFQAILLAQIDESQSGISSWLHKIEQSLCDSLRDQEDIFKNLSQGAHQEARTIDDVQSLRFNEFRKHTLAQNSSIFTGLADVRKEVQEVNAKVDILASRLNDVQKDVEATKEAISHQLFEFQSQAQENQNILHAQLSELVDYIHRGGADKKGESSSRGAQISASAERTPTFAQRVEIAQRRIVETVLDADRNAESLERQAAAERDRERRRREARSLKRRRS